MQTNMNNTNLRFLSQIFSTSVFKKIVSNDYTTFDNIVMKHYSTYKSTSSNLELLNNIYSNLSNNYRCEYIYKNLVFKEILKKYSLNTTVTFNEFKIADSKADVFLINGIARIFEIKTELDDFSKLQKQISDYQKIADEVYIVSGALQSKKLLEQYLNTDVGVIKLTNTNKLVTLKKATKNNDNLEFDSLFKLLRKKEYLHLVKINFGFIPDVPNTKIFRVCYELLNEIDICTFHLQVLNILKKRKLKRADLLVSDKTPFELRFICNALDLNEDEYENLFNFLDNNHLCTTHILEENNLNSLVLEK
ncbi:sce7726 family protein [Chryseobacterium sp. PTM-20240506]|uniref:sce7726 family protein n=1 Tax=Chryseobacterium sp. PTM-20240506 TaxID=3400631 RepID=UPI00293C1880|nr:sce7726 family protein [Elizabethkingia anophelis]MDV3596579.1 hypothetical protein [Elizabethkingia anophelis]